MSPQSRTLSVVIPVYNAAPSLPALVAALHEALPALAAQYEIILVEDDGQDASWAVIEALAAGDPLVRGFKLMRNYGQHNALLCGVRAARCDVIVTMDDDLQHPPAEIARLLAALEDGADVVYGRPDGGDGRHGPLRRAASEVTKIVLQNAMGADTARNISAFRAFRAPLRAAFAHYSGPWVNLDVLLTWATTRFTAIPVRHEARRFGASNYTFRKLLTHSFNMITGFSTVPLQLASLLGIIMTVFGLLVLVYVVGRTLIENAAPPGFPFLASVVAIFAGAQMFAIGIIGEYLARMHFRLMEKPTYVVRTTTGEGADQAVIEAASASETA
jgi:undecaprenyl-phosphate 4-deoxy-4-formamido-L-arabinose transferase